MALRGEMRSMLRRRIDDVRDSRWTDSDLNDELNHAMFYVVGQIGLYQRINYLSDSYLLTTLAGRTRYPLPHNFNKVWSVFETSDVDDEDPATPPIDSPFVRPCLQIDEREAPLKRNTNGRNDTADGGHWFFFIGSAQRVGPDIPPDAEDPPILVTQQHIIGFPVIPPIGTLFLIMYSRTPETIVMDNLVGDSMSYAVPERHHELIVVRAALQLVGTDEARYDFLVATWNDLYAKLLDDIGYMPDLYSHRLLPRGMKPAFLSPAARRSKPEAFGGGPADVDPTGG